eukprot:1732014-Amphidinium_carterae.1
MRTVDVNAADYCKQRESGNASFVSRLDAALACALQFVDDHAAARPQDRFSLVSFNDKASILLEATTCAAFRTKVESTFLVGNTGTCYTGALKAAEKLLAKRLGQPAHLVLLSDGRPADTKAALSFFQAHFLQGL